MNTIVECDNIDSPYKFTMELSAREASNICYRLQVPKSVIQTVYPAIVLVVTADDWHTAVCQRIFHLGPHVSVHRQVKAGLE